MRGGALPPALLLAALGLALASARPRVWLWSVVALDATLGLLSFVVVPRAWEETVFLGCWASTVATAAGVHLPKGPGLRGGVALSVNAGVWALSLIHI